MADVETTKPPATWTFSPGRVRAFAGLLFVDFVLVAVMLATDKNLQTDFGAQQAYFSHWYGLLAEGVFDLIVAGALAASVSTGGQRWSSSSRRTVVVGALAYTVVAILAMLGIVATYQQVGFASVNQFAQYLFGVTPYPGVLSYIPWLYDLLLAMYLVTAVVGAVAARRVPGASLPTPPA